MAESVRRQATYNDLFNLPDHVIGEIIGGELIATPRPSGGHANAAAILGGEIIPPYRLGRGGPGGWVILFEHEIKLGKDLLVPDFSGWKNERFPGWPKENWISVPPDWICEILSPATARVDKVYKMPIYGAYEVRHLWLIDPMIKTLDVFRLESGRWTLLAAFGQEDKVRAEPFQEVEIDLANLWID